MFVIYIKLSLWPDDVISDYKRYFFPINNNNYALYGFYNTLPICFSTDVVLTTPSEISY